LNVFGRLSRQCLDQRLVAALGLVYLDIDRIQLGDAFGQNGIECHGITSSHTALTGGMPKRSEMAAGSSPFLMSSMISSARSGVALPQYSKLTWSAGAPSHAAMHSPVTSSVIKPYGVVAPTLMPSRRSRWSTSSWAPDRPHVMLPQTVMTYLPMGRR